MSIKIEPISALTWPSHSHDDLYYTETEMDAALLLKVPTARTITTTAPLAGGGSLSADKTFTLAVDATDLGVDGSNQLYIKDTGIAHDSTTGYSANRHIDHTGVTLTLTSPLSGSGDVSANRTFSLAGLSTLGTANYVVGANAAASAWEYKQLIAGTNISVVHGVGSVTLNATAGGASVFTDLTDCPANYTGAASKYVKVNAGETALEFVAGSVSGHDLVSGTHTAAGLTAGHFLKATAATTFAFAAHGLTYTDVGAAATSHAHVWADVSKSGSNLSDLATKSHTSLSGVSSDQHHAQVHTLTGTDHTVAGLTTGHFMKASGATAFGFAAHGLTYTDVGAAATAHAHAGVYDPAGTGHTEATAHVTLHESTYNHVNYNTAYGWGNHASAGYLTSVTAHTIDGASHSVSSISTAYLRGDKTFQTLNQAAVAGLTTADDVIHRGPLCDVRSYASFAAAVAAIGATETTLLIPSQQAVTVTVSLPTTLSLMFTRGGSLNISAAVVVTINGPLHAGLHQIFEGTGGILVKFGAGSVAETYPQWWGATGTYSEAVDDQPAIQAAIDAATPDILRTYIPAGEYCIKSQVRIGNPTGFNLYGQGWRTILYAGGNVSSLVYWRSSTDEGAYPGAQANVLCKNFQVIMRNRTDDVQYSGHAFEFIRPYDGGMIENLRGTKVADAYSAFKIHGGDDASAVIGQSLTGVSLQGNHQLDTSTTATFSMHGMYECSFTDVKMWNGGSGIGAGASFFLSDCRSIIFINPATALSTYGFRIWSTGAGGGNCCIGISLYSPMFESVTNPLYVSSDSASIYNYAIALYNTRHDSYVTGQYYLNQMRTSNIDAPVDDADGVGGCMARFYTNTNSNRINVPEASAGFVTNDGAATNRIFQNGVLYVP